MVNSDGNIYFTIGGRRAESALYCVKYTGDESTAPASYPTPTKLALERRKLEAGHQPDAEIDLESIITALNSDDRSIRYAARIALENQPSEKWADKVNAQPTQAKLELAMAITRVAPKQQAAVVEALSSLDFPSLTGQQKLQLIRTYSLVLCRMGDPEVVTKQALSLIHI